MTGDVVLAKKLSGLLSGLILSVALSGCVTTGLPQRQEVDIEKAVQTHVQLGLRYLRNGDNREAARHHFNKALELGKKDPMAHLGLALMYQTDGEVEVAESHFKKALRYGDNFSMARTNYGAFLYQQERYEEALVQFEKAASDLTYNRRSYALTNYGRTAAKLGKVEEAEKAYTRALALDDDLPQALLELAELKFNTGAYVEAKHYLDRYSAKNRQIPQSLWLGIRIEKIFGNRDKERSYALALKNLYPYSAEALKYKQTMANDG
ncbi:type IV pilus biogenesis/stability protein PilW [Microbulbifer thermotolerans]|uniref:Pilus assembly protein PilW n=1 Tax=Microbulbifer thermotolerans TaxID=252514 RepID=A0A143HNL0_MICTH|nr:type IV pilus biogenesis/stability protein PilW [Microbulbifer thermotolerans]AMX03091.1 pilus assembly protein PilW [Microbulbifer thermotolerans]MCX2784366.1 type IV pilus biogenesis/stability protein PilW [Microbulbifer thermotolerans]MCX2831475.1 type IV pilus biogenesis/stability protein PilW [Microbulbifer thermotolerans]